MIGARRIADWYLPRKGSSNVSTASTDTLMKIDHRHLIAAVAALALIGCRPSSPNNADQSTPTPEAKPSQAAAPATPVARAPVAAIPTTPAPATPPPVAAELAPPGIFYMIATVQVETGSGIAGLKPGDGVKFLRPGVYQSNVGEVQLRPDQITNDLGVARRAVAADRQAQAAYQQRTAPAASQQPTAQAIYQQPVTQAMPPNTQQPVLDAGQKQQQRAALEAQRAALYNQLTDLQAKQKHEAQRKILYGSINAGSTQQDINQVNAQILSLTDKINALY